MGSGFEPDAETLRLLQSEHVNGTWVGRELLPIANRIRNAGGDEGEYYRRVTGSTLWGSYTCSTSDSVTKQEASLENAWWKSEESKPFELDDVLADLTELVAEGNWPGRAGNRNRAVALAFVGYCRDRNCYTRTISSYELAKQVPGTSPRTAARALADLVKIGLLKKIDRTDRRSSRRSTTRYQINLYWTPTPALGVPRSCKANGVSDSRSTSKYSLRHLCHIDGEIRGLDLTHHDTWTHQGLGQSAQRVWAALPDHPGSDAMALDDPASIYDDASITCVGKSPAELVSEIGLSRRTVDTALKRLFDNCMAVELPGKPHRWLRAAYPPVDALAEASGYAGTIADTVERIEKRQHANRTAYPGTYTPNPYSQEATTSAA